jgi:single-strand DNA-binding protein
MVNRTILQGRLCADPEMRRTNNGTAVCSFRVAWSETIKDRETKLFLNCVAWQGTAELICKYWHKGKEILLEGKLSTREYDDRDGNRRNVTEMNVDMVHFCGKNEDAQGMTPRTDGKSQFVEIDEDEDLGSLLPF